MKEKQRKVSSAIAHCLESGQTTPVGTKPNDECYTSMDDILKELSYWGRLGKFKGKNIICPCDWDITNKDPNVYCIEVSYDENKINSKNNSPFACADYVQLSIFDNNIETKQIDPDKIAEFLGELSCNFVRALTQNAKTWGIKSITASGYNPATGKGVKFQDIDYSKYDICITNPPFSLYAEFMDTIVGKIDFVCLAPFLNRVAPNIGLPLMLKQAYLGYGRDLAMNFVNPNKENKFNSKKVRCDWITSWDNAQLEVNANYRPLDIQYETYADEYQTYSEITMKDGTHPIRVPSTKYPTNYTGWMIASVNVLDNLNTDIYEWYGTSFKKYYNSTNPNANPFSHQATDKMMKINGKLVFHGILFRKKPVETASPTTT